MDYRKVGLLHEQFVEIAKSSPSKIAVVDECQGSMTYKELDYLTDKLASILQKRGAKENSIVIIYMDKCLQYVVSYIAILKAGSAYLPLDISCPQHLIKDFLHEAEPLIIITKSSFTGILEKTNSRNYDIILLEDHIFSKQLDILQDNESINVLPCSTLESLGFVSFSSGTTGKPKGIMVPLRAPIISYLWRHETYPYGDNEREAANIFFVWELLRPLMKGQTLYIIPDGTIYDPEKLLEYLKTNLITRMLFTPSLLETVLEFPQISVENGFRTMRQIWLCGEVTTTTLIDRALRLLPHVQFVNLYSISECYDVAAVDLTKFYYNKPEKLKSSKFTPVGKLLPLVKVVILDEYMKVLPVGVAGEIYVYGPTLALGYLRRPELNAKRFLPLPFELRKEGEEIMFRTGDWGYQLSDGSLEISGRCDSMVKIRGYSVEISAIESVLIELPYVQSCAVVMFGEEGEDKYLVAYIVRNQATTTKTIRGELKRRLPFYMIPSYFVFINEIPILAVSGKLNKKALPPLDEFLLHNKSEYLPETETERVLAEIWSQVLKVQSIDVQESFFDLGGHSLLAAKLLQIVNNKLNIQITVTDFYTNPTISQMAKLIDKKSSDNVVKVDLQKEVDLHCQYDADFDIQLRAFWRFSSFNRLRWSNARVLITGSTGFLGAFILAELLKSTDSHVFCLIRENLSIPNSGDIGKIQKRLYSTLRRYCLMDAEEDGEKNDGFERLIKDRVTFVQGDVSIVNFGLSDNDYRYLSTEIDFIIHAAAYVNLVYPYSALYNSNVFGTCNVIKFASYSKIKPLLYISTDGIFPDNIVGHEYLDVSQCWTDLKNGYSQSKWVAEQLVSRISQRGHPVIIFRMGNLGPDSINAAMNTEDFNFMMIRSFAYLDSIPDIDWKIEMTPVNFSAEVIVKFAKSLPDHVGQIYHLINHQRLDIMTLRSWMKTFGYECHLVSYEEYLDRLKTSKHEFLTKLYSMLSDVAKSADYFQTLPLHSSSNTRTVCNGKIIHYPIININMFNLFVTKFLHRNFMPKPNRNREHCKSKVAVITGASSGIGKETAIQLAKSGCIVALIARNEDKLHKIQDTINREGGRAMFVSTDITDGSQVAEAIKVIENALGPVDILVNCAGTMYYQHVYKLKMPDCNTMIDVNIKGLLYCTTAVVAGMVQRRKGHIVNISSDAGRIGFAGLAVYSGTKFFVEGYSQSLRKEVSQYNVRVSCIQPGDVRTPLQKSSIADAEAANEYCAVKDDSEILQAKDIAKTIVFVVNSPSYVAFNEVLVEPVSMPI